MEMEGMWLEWKRADVIWEIWRLNWLIMVKASDSILPLISISLPFIDIHIVYKNPRERIGGRRIIVRDWERMILNLIRGNATGGFVLKYTLQRHVDS